jgi:acyl carrier protein phosphodiesterase
MFLEFRKEIDILQIPFKSYSYMNFLAHVYFSHESDDAIIGAFLGDFVKGDDWKNYPDDIGKAILLHRSIDSFTDSHTLFKQAKFLLDEPYKRFAGIMIDVYYDHFLAKNWVKYSTENLESFALKTYSVLKKKSVYLPTDTRLFVEYMLRHNLLLNYQHLICIDMVMKAMSQRFKRTNPLDSSILQLEKNYLNFESIFNDFMIDLKIFVDCKKML